MNAHMNRKYSGCLLSLLLLASTAAHAQVQWREGPMVYTPAYDFTLGYTPNGTGYYVRQAWIASPPQPTVNQAFYVSLRMEGIASPSVGATKTSRTTASSSAGCGASAT